MTLYSYCLRYDDGAAPNLYWEVCTLTICKPAIRRTASEGDWVVGLGSANSPIGDISNSLVYAMKVTQVKTLEEYDQYCTSSLVNKIPNWRDEDFRRRVGDCLYDYSKGSPPRMREGVHSPENFDRDLSGQRSLLSSHFYYFGDAPIQLPDFLLPIVHSTQGHKSLANDPYADAFTKWIEALGYKLNTPHGEPQLRPFLEAEFDVRGKCAQHDPDES